MAGKVAVIVLPIMQANDTGTWTVKSKSPYKL